MAETNITYTTTSLGTYDLQYEDPLGQSTILVSNITSRHLSQKEIITREDTIRDSFDIVDVKYSRKIITVTGWLISNNVTNLRTLRDNFMHHLRPSEGSLTINDGSGNLVYKATVQSIDVPEEFWHIAQLPFTITFLCEPFGKGALLSPTAWTAISTGATNKSACIDGTYKAKPIITITVVTESDLTIFKWDNVTTGDWIQVEPSSGFANLDVLVINCENETVTLNGSDQDFTGVFPLFNPRINNITLTTTAIACNVTVSYTYYPTYL